MYTRLPIGARRCPTQTVRSPQARPGSSGGEPALPADIVLSGSACRRPMPRQTVRPRYLGDGRRPHAHAGSRRLKLHYAAADLRRGAGRRESLSLNHQPRRGWAQAGASGVRFEHSSPRNWQPMLPATRRRPVSPHGLKKALIGFCGPCRIYQATSGMAAKILLVTRVTAVTGLHAGKNRLNFGGARQQEVSSTFEMLSGTSNVMRIACQV